MESTSRQTNTNPTSPVRITVQIETRDPTLSPVFTSIFDLDTVVLSPSSVSNLSAASEVPTVVYAEQIPPANSSQFLNSPKATTEAVPKETDDVTWYAIRKSIHGRSLIVNSWIDYEPHVKVRVPGRHDKVIPPGVDFRKFKTFEDAVAFFYSP